VYYIEKRLLDGKIVKESMFKACRHPGGPQNIWLKVARAVMCEYNVGL